MKPVLEVYNEKPNEYIVVLSKDISDIKGKYEITLETQKFYKNEAKKLEEAIDILIIEILQDFGIIPSDITKEAIRSAFMLLQSKHGITIDIEDEYEVIPNRDAKMVYRNTKLNQTCIIENDILSIANKIIVKEI